MSTVVLVTTGGTIASTSDRDGAKRAAAGGADLLGGLTPPAGVDVEVVDLLRLNSAAMTFADLDAVRAAVIDALADPGVAGVVVTHGTDTLEETALLVDLSHADPRPVVFTGAQRSFDQPDTDGPRNLRDALTVAAASGARGRGALVVFDGSILAVRGTRKVHNASDAAFDDPDRGALGTVSDGVARIAVSTLRDAPLPPVPISGTRVDTVALYPGVDRVALDAVAAAGAEGIVLEAPGTGNTHPVIVSAVREHVAAGLVVVVSTRVHGGEVRPVYGGGGGGVDLGRAGAIPAGPLRPSQARILLAALLAARADRARIAAAFGDPAEGSVDPGPPFTVSSPR